MGVLVARRRPRVLWWTVPLLLILASLLVGAGTLGVALIPNLGGRTDDVMGAAATGLVGTSLATIAAWSLDVLETRWQPARWWLVGLVGLSATWILVVVYVVALG